MANDYIGKYSIHGSYGYWWFKCLWLIICQKCTKLSKTRAWWSTITTWWLNLNPFENAINSSHWIIPSQGGKQKSAHLWPFGGWKKSCTTWDVKHPVNSGINYQPQLVSRISEPSTACWIKKVQKHRSEMLDCCVQFHLTMGGNVDVLPPETASISPGFPFPSLSVAPAPIKPHDVFFSDGKSRFFLRRATYQTFALCFFFFFSDVCCILLETEQTRKMVQMLSPLGFYGDTRETKKYLLPLVI